jgi:hypothetical protein
VTSKNTIDTRPDAAVHLAELSADDLAYVAGGGCEVKVSCSANDKGQVECKAELVCKI